MLGTDLFINQVGYRRYVDVELIKIKLSSFSLSLSFAFGAQKWKFGLGNQRQWMRVKATFTQHLQLILLRFTTRRYMRVKSGLLLYRGDYTLLCSPFQLLSDSFSSDFYLLLLAYFTWQPSSFLVVGVNLGTLCNPAKFQVLIFYLSFLSAYDDFLRRLFRFSKQKFLISSFFKKKIIPKQIVLSRFVIIRLND